jgi:hypothetical protein
MLHSEITIAQVTLHSGFTIEQVALFNGIRNSKDNIT